MRQLRLTWLGRCAREPELDRESRGRACALGPELGTCEVEALARIGRPLGCCGERGTRVSRPSPGHIISLANHRHLSSHRPHILNDMSGEDLPNTDIITLTRYVLRILHRHPRNLPVLIARAHATPAAMSFLTSSASGLPPLVISPCF